METRTEYLRLDRELMYHYPTNTKEVLPTALGNRLRAAEQYPHTHYGLDALIVWPRLWHLLPVPVQESIASSRQALDEAVRLFGWGLLTALWGIWAWWAVPLGLGLAVAAWFRALHTAEVYGELIRTAFDLYRFALYEALRWPPPSDSDAEYEYGKQLTAYLFRGLLSEPVKFVHPKNRDRIVSGTTTSASCAGNSRPWRCPDVEKITVDNNEFGLKYRILQEQPEQKFLLYHEGPPPEDDLDNWLLDVQLAYGQFRADQISLWLHELGLGLEFTDVVAPHTDFFQAARRREGLNEILAPDDTPRRLRLKMLAVCARAEPRLDDILEQLLDELAADRDDKRRLIQRCTLDAFLWDELERAYGYTSDDPSVRDFAITLFDACYAMGVDVDFALNSDALVFLKRWKDSVRHQQAFRDLSAEYAEILDIAQDLETREYANLVPLDTFELIDRKILSGLVRDVAQQTIPLSDVESLIRRRRRSHWYPRYRHEYEAVEEAAAFMKQLEQVDLTVTSLVAGIEQYVNVWYTLDQHYRKFIYHKRQSGRATLLEALADQVENHYTNTYLLRLNNDWQTAVDDAEVWDSYPILSQQDFFAREVQPFLDRNHKVFVIISDGLRYEIGEELLREIRQEDRYDAELDPALTLLPSYTQLGMAALLPHERLEIRATAGRCW